MQPTFIILLPTRGDQEYEGGPREAGGWVHQCSCKKFPPDICPVDRVRVQSYSINVQGYQGLGYSYNLWLSQKQGQVRGVDVWGQMSYIHIGVFTSCQCARGHVLSHSSHSVQHIWPQMPSSAGLNRDGHGQPVWYDAAALCHLHSCSGRRPASIECGVSQSQLAGGLCGQLSNSLVVDFSNNWSEQFETEVRIIQTNSSFGPCYIGLHLQ